MFASPTARERGIDTELLSLASSDSMSSIACELHKEYDHKDTWRRSLRTIWMFRIWRNCVSRSVTDMLLLRAWLYRGLGGSYMKRLWPALNQSPGRSAKFRQMYLKNMQYTLGLPLFKQSRGPKICNFPLESGPFWPQKYGNFPPTYRGASRGLTQLVIQGALFFSAICHILLGHVVHVTHPILLLRIWGLGDFSGQTLSDSAYCTYHFKYGVVVLPPFKKDIGIFGLTTGNYHFDHKFTRCYALPHELVVQIFYVH